jgi:hypothetical protein
MKKSCTDSIQFQYVIFMILKYESSYFKTPFHYYFIHIKYNIKLNQEETQKKMKQKV